MTSPNKSRIKIVVTLAVLTLAIGSSGCIDTTKMASPTITPPEETFLPAPSTPDAAVEIMDEANLVHNVIFHRAMYARMLEALVDYYSRSGQSEKAAWARTELSDLRRVKIYKYVSDAVGPRAEGNTVGFTRSLTIVPTFGSSPPIVVTQVADREEPPPQEPPPSLEHPAGVETPDIPLENMGEADLVENMAFHRNMYHRFLNALTTYYSENGFPEKAAWAQTELNGLRRVKTYKYIMDAEVPRADLKPLESIAEADRLYRQGLELLRKGGRGFPCFYNQATMRQARSRFKALIDNYPTSDKIDDAAYYIGEIYKEYEKEQDNIIAIEWYKRAIQWDPNTPHPCRFRIATTYDYRLHERENALYWYQRVLDEESRFTARDHIDFAGNTRYARARIRELTPEEHLRAPGEVIGNGPPAPAPGPEPDSASVAPAPGP